MIFLWWPSTVSRQNLSEVRLLHQRQYKRAIFLRRGIWTWRSLPLSKTALTLIYRIWAVLLNSPQIFLQLVSVLVYWLVIIWLQSTDPASLVTWAIFTSSQDIVHEATNLNYQTLSAFSSIQCIHTLCFGSIVLELGVNLHHLDFQWCFQGMLRKDFLFIPGLDGQIWNLDSLCS